MVKLEKIIFPPAGKKYTHEVLVNLINLDTPEFSKVFCAEISYDKKQLPDVVLLRELMLFGNVFCASLRGDDSLMTAMEQLKDAAESLDHNFGSQWWANNKQTLDEFFTEHEDTLEYVATDFYIEFYALSCEPVINEEET